MTVILRVFDPAQCCATGVCGPSVDPQLARFAADLDWLKAQGVTVARFNLAQQPGAFVRDAAVSAALEARGESALPIIKVGDAVRSEGVYPSRDALAAWAGVAPEAPAAAPSPCCSPAPAATVPLGAAPKKSCC